MKLVHQLKEDKPVEFLKICQKSTKIIVFGQEKHLKIAANDVCILVHFL